MLNAVQIEQPSPILHVFFASQTGNGEAIAKRLGWAAEQSGLPVKTQSLLLLKPAALRKLHYAVFVISTHGEGDPPDDALDLLNFLENSRAPQLPQLRFRVLALGDSSYVQFCQAGRNLERLLEARGAVKFAERTECDLDYQQPAEQFSGEVIEFGRETLGQDHTVEPAANPQSSAPQLSIVPNSPMWSRQRPFPATVESVFSLTVPESLKDIHHVTLSLAGSGLAYEPGDSLGVWAHNNPELVSELLRTMAIDPATRIERGGATRTVRDWLTQHLEITRLAPDSVKAWATLTGSPRLAEHLNGLSADQFRAFNEQRQLIDLATEFPVQTDTSGLLQLLRPLTPRSYSIASSQAAVEDEAHLTVATRQSHATQRQRLGVASEFLNHRLQPGDTVGVFLESNLRFRLPEDRSKPIIVIAAGTGIAPYRAFFQQLEQEERSSRTWLIFGNPNLRSDFLYQSEWLNWRASGLLERIDTAFSRDQAEKRYVQHVVLDRSAQISEWLDWGAHIYLCGALAMGEQVEHALRQGLVKHRGLTAGEASARLSQLRRERRLMKDLY
jgi:sulfite reductase (NADPH) flavoprotein alpha-component